MLVTLFCGSTGLQSANRAVLDVVAATLQARGHSVNEAAPLAEIPIFQPQMVDDAPPAVMRLRQQFETADAVIVAIPEYGGGAAGWAKNALDWMVGSASLYRRVAAVMSAGTTGGANAIEQITRTLTWQGAFVVATVGIAAPRTKSDTAGRLVDPVTVNHIAAAIERIIVAVSADEDTRSRLAQEVLAPLHIDLLDRRTRRAPNP